MGGLCILVLATVLILGLPVILPLAALLHTREMRRRRRTADVFPCVQCGQILGLAALERADTAWAEHVDQMYREHPGYMFRLVRDLDAVCTRCGAPCRYDDKRHTFCRPDRR